MDEAVLQNASLRCGCIAPLPPKLSHVPYRRIAGGREQDHFRFVVASVDPAQPQPTLGVSSLDLGRSSLRTAFFRDRRPGSARGPDPVARVPRSAVAASGVIVRRLRDEPLTFGCPALQKTHLQFVRCTTNFCIATSTSPARPVVALLGRFLPRLGPFGLPNGPFSLSGRRVVSIPPVAGIGLPYAPEGTRRGLVARSSRAWATGNDRIGRRAAGRIGTRRIAAAPTGDLRSIASQHTLAGVRPWSRPEPFTPSLGVSSLDLTAAPKAAVFLCASRRAPWWAARWHRPRQGAHSAAARSAMREGSSKNNRAHKCSRSLRNPSKLAVGVSELSSM